MCRTYKTRIYMRTKHAYIYICVQNTHIYTYAYKTRIYMRTKHAYIWCFVSLYMRLKDTYMRLKCLVKNNTLN